MKVLFITVTLVLILYIIFFHTPLIFMFLTVRGRSMFPTYNDGDKLWSLRSYLCTIRVGDVVVAKPYQCDSKMVIKRVHKIENGHYYILGDNSEDSYDSRDYGWLSEKEIVAKVMKHKL